MDIESTGRYRTIVDSGGIIRKVWSCPGLTVYGIAPDGVETIGDVTGQILHGKKDARYPT